MSYCGKCGAELDEMFEYCPACLYGRKSAERSGAAQPCPPSATGSASAAPKLVAYPKLKEMGSDTETPIARAEDGPGADSSSVQLPVSDLAAAVAGEIAILKKQIELMKLRVDESEGTPINKTLRSFGSCLWRHKCRLEKALAAASAPGAAGQAAEAERQSSATWNHEEYPIDT